MKASIKFREEQKPLVRAKIPLSILGCPFQSGIVAGESKELSLNIATFFDAGPSLKLTYKPNDSFNPFTLVFRTGIGHFGSPVNSPMSMSAEFNLIGTQNPRFFIHFRPKLGDFAIKKSQSSDFVKTVKPKPNSVVVASDDEVLVEAVEKGLFYGDRIGVPPSESAAAAGLIGGLLRGMEASARTVLPVANRAVVNFRWGFRFPLAEGAAGTVAVKRNPTAGFSVQQLPVLVMSKIGIEHVADDGAKDSNKVVSGLTLQGSDGVAETCLGVKRQLELIHAENDMLRKAMDDLKSEFASGKHALPAFGGGVDSGRYREGERGGAKPSGGRVDQRSNGDKKASEYNRFGGGKATEGDANEELKKALKDAAGA